MPIYRICVVLGSIPLIAFFAWPWINRVLIAPALDQQISIQAGGVTTHFPAAMGLFGTFGLVAMLLAVKR